MGDLVTCRREDHPRPRQRGAGSPPWSLRSELGAELPVECRQASPPADKADRRERPQYHLETGKGRARAGRGKDRGLNQGAGAADRQLRSHESARPSRIQPEKVAKSARRRCELRRVTELRRGLRRTIELWQQLLRAIELRAVEWLRGLLHRLCVAVRQVVATRRVVRTLRVVQAVACVASCSRASRCAAVRRVVQLCVRLSGRPHAACEVGARAGRATDCTTGAGQMACSGSGGRSGGGGQASA